MAGAFPVVPFDDRSVSGRAIRERRSIVADEPRAEHEAKYPASFLHKIGFQAEVVVPLLHRDAALGTLLVFRRERLPFDGRHVELLETFADQAVIAIENARLFQELQHRVEESACPTSPSARSSSTRSWSSSKSRAFSMAMTAWSAYVSSRAIC